MPEISDTEALVRGTAESQGATVGDFVVVVEDHERTNESQHSDENPNSVVAEGQEFLVPVPADKNLRLTLFHGAYIPCMLPVEVPGGHSLVVHVVVEPQTGEEVLLAE